MLRKLVIPLLDVRRQMHPNDPAIARQWEAMAVLLGRDGEATIEFLNACSETEIYWLSEVFDDVSAALQSTAYIACLDQLTLKFPALNLSVDIEAARSNMK